MDWTAKAREFWDKWLAKELQTGPAIRKNGDWATSFAAAFASEVERETLERADSGVLMDLAMTRLGEIHDSLPDGCCLPEDKCSACNLQMELLLKMADLAGGGQGRVRE